LCWSAAIAEIGIKASAKTKVDFTTRSLVVMKFITPSEIFMLPFDFTNTNFDFTNSNVSPRQLRFSFRGGGLD
jgi:hypothetical protein